ncbi:MAG: methyltransferase domain-containing protein [bacterium]|nr:methyltransferase domain-containing protein [bacterium]
MTGYNLRVIEEATALTAWLDAHPAAGILDVRPASDFVGRHIRGAVSLPPAAAARTAAELEAVLPSILLPPRHRPLLVVAGAVDIALRLAGALSARGRARLAAAAPLPAALGALPERLCARGPGAGALWEAPAWLTDHADLLPPAALGPALDLGCGSGRAAVWLAARGYRVTGLDHQPEALALMSRLAASAGVAVSGIRADVRAAGAVPPGPWGVLVNIRCLQRPLLTRLRDYVSPHGVAVVRGFRDAPGWAPDITAAHRLRPAELVHAFPPGTWEVLAHEEGFDDDGRPAAGIVARRLGGL